MTVTKTFTPRPTESRGPADSDKFNDMLAEIHHDLTNVVDQVNRNESSARNISKLLFQEFMNARNLSARYKEDVENQQLLDAKLSNDIYTLMGFRTMAGPNYYVDFTNIPVARRARVEAQYGTVILPYNYIVNRMYAIDPETGDPLIPGDLRYTLTWDADGATELDDGTVKNAFNGNNRDYWIAKASFPLDSDVDNVGVTLNVTMPDTLVSDTNMINIHPFPLGQLEIEELLYSTTTADPSTDLLTGTVRSAGFERWHFSDLSITKLQIGLRQRHFIEEDGKKVFYIGAQEIASQLVDFDKTSGEAQPSDNNGLILVVDAPSGYKFNILKRLYSVPGYESMPSNEIGIRIYTDSGLTSLAWSSYTDPKLEDSNVDISSESVSTIYILVTLAFITGQGQSPVLNDIVLGYDTTT
jgi:hypothetical protein